MGNARINATVMNTTAQTIARRVKNISEGKSERDPKSVEIQVWLLDFIRKQPNHEKTAMLKHLYKRFLKEGDDFRNITGYGQYNELVSGIMLGIFSSKEDIDNYKVYDTIPYWEEGDIVSIEKDRKEPVHHQVKGSGGTLSWRRGGEFPVNHKIGFKKSHFTSNGFFNPNMADGTKSGLVAKALEAYIQESPTDIRIVSPIYPNAIKGVFDIGAETFKQMAYIYPSAFKFQLNTKKAKPYIGQDIPIDRAVRLWTAEMMKQEGGAIKDVEDILNISSEYKRSQQTAAKYIEGLVWDWRIKFWEAYGSIRFFYDGRTLARLVSPVIDTGIGRKGDKQPFYDLLLDLYGQSSAKGWHQLPRVNYYLRYNENTEENKQPDYFYNNQYHDIRY